MGQTCPHYPRTRTHARTHTSATVSSKKRKAEEATTEEELSAQTEKETHHQPANKATKLMDQLPTVEEAEANSSALVEHPYESFEDLLFNNMRMEALDEMERSIRYVLDVNDDLSVLSGGFFRHGMFGALADMTGSSLISHIYDHMTPGSMLDMKLHCHGLGSPAAHPHHHLILLIRPC